MEKEGKMVGKLGGDRLNLFRDPELKGPGPYGKPLARQPDITIKKYKQLEIFQGPVQLISADESKHLGYNEDALAELMKVEHEVSVVAVVGKYRTGKSLLLNRLAEMDGAFGVGHTHNAETKGIWLLCRPHPTKESQVVVLLDTEGLDDALKENMIEDRWHFVLATLLSSTLVYNIKGALDADAIKKLEDIKSTISVTKSAEGDDSYLDVFFPTFVMVVRDNTLETVDKDKNSITADQFMENVLKLARGDRASVIEYNEPRLLIRRYFKDRKCFMINPPRRYEHMDDPSVKVINGVFEGQVEKFRNFIFDCKPKRMTAGKILNGRMLGRLIKSYTSSIQKGQSPCIHEAAKEMIEYENQSIVQSAVDVYKKELQRLVGENMPSSETMGDFHQQSTDKAVEFLHRNIVYDNVELFMDTAKGSFLVVLENLMKSIEKDSENKCWNTLNRLDTGRIGKKISLGTYAHIAGYDEYIKDIDWVIKQYRKTPALGPKAEQVLQTFLDGKKEEEEHIYRVVKKAQEEANTSKEMKSTEILRSPPIKLSGDVNSKPRPDNQSEVPDKLLDIVMKEQALQKQDMQESFFTFMKFKTQEYERQLAEGAESASKTQEENEIYREIFVKGSVPTGPRKKADGDETPAPSPGVKTPGVCKIF